MSIDIDFIANFITEDPNVFEEEQIYSHIFNEDVSTILKTIIREDSPLRNRILSYFHDVDPEDPENKPIGKPILIVGIKWNSRDMGMYYFKNAVIYTPTNLYDIDHIQVKENQFIRFGIGQPEMEQAAKNKTAFLFIGRIMPYSQQRQNEFKIWDLSLIKILDSKEDIKNKIANGRSLDMYAKIASDYYSKSPTSIHDVKTLVNKAWASNIADESATGLKKCKRCNEINKEEEHDFCKNCRNYYCTGCNSFKKEYLHGKCEDCKNEEARLYQTREREAARARALAASRQMVNMSTPRRNRQNG